MSLSAINAASSALSSATSGIALASSLQSAELVVGLLAEGQQNLEALVSQIDPPQQPPVPTLDGTGVRVNRSV